MSLYLDEALFSLGNLQAVYTYDHIRRDLELKV